jgi:cytidyltransferase-like protein
MVIAPEKKRVLGLVFALGLEGDVTEEVVAGRLQTDLEYVAEKLNQLAEQQMITRRGGRISLTEKGRKSIKVVFIGGGFEIIHPGHIHTIEQAKSLGDALVVVIARDTTIRMRKRRNPVTSEEDRLHLLSSLRQVDTAILGVHGDIYSTLEKVKPDIVALGYDQHHAESDIVKEGTKRGLNLKVVRLSSSQPKLKTSKLLSET